MCVDWTPLYLLTLEIAVLAVLIGQIARKSDAKWTLLTLAAFVVVGVLLANEHAAKEAANAETVAISNLCGHIGYDLCSDYIESRPKALECGGFGFAQFLLALLVSLGVLALFVYKTKWPKLLKKPTRKKN